MPNPSTIAMEEEVTEVTQADIIADDADTLEIQDLKNALEASEEVVAGLDSLLKSYDVVYDERLGELDALKRTIELLSHDLKTAREGRDRVLAENCRMTEINRGLTDFYRATDALEVIDMNIAEATSQSDIDQLFIERNLLEDARNAGRDRYLAATK